MDHHDNAPHYTFDEYVGDDGCWGLLLLGRLGRLPRAKLQRRLLPIPMNLRGSSTHTEHMGKIHNHQGNYGFGAAAAAAALLPGDAAGAAGMFIEAMARKDIPPDTGDVALANGGLAVFPPGRITAAGSSVADWAG